MKCAVCGADIPEGSNVCPDCGTEVSIQEGVSQPPLQPSTPPVSEGVPEPTPAVPAPTPAVPPAVVVGKARLLVKRGGALTGEEFAISGRVVIGRFTPETGPVDIDLAHLPESDYITRRHAEIYQDESGQWFVKDLGSTNGTFVRPLGSSQFQRVPANQSAPINDGDELAFGNARFVFKTQ